MNSVESLKMLNTFLQKPKTSVKYISFTWNHKTLYSWKNHANKKTQINFQKWQFYLFGLLNKYLQ